jgi:purine-binding chemotaxis protein CheW
MNKHLRERMVSFPDLATVIENIDARLAEAVRGSVPATHRARLAQEKPTKYILVDIGTLRLAIAMEDLSEVGPLPKVTSLPNLPSWIQGVVNVRSEIISVIDLPDFLWQGGADRCDGNRFVILLSRKRKIGLRLDRIVGTVLRLQSETQPLDAFDKKPIDTALFTSGLLIEQQAYFILNVRRLLTTPRLIDYNRAGRPEER